MKTSHGFTFIEVVIVMGLVSILLAIVGQTLFRSHQSVNLDTERQKLVSDIKNQQMRAMNSDTSSPGVYSDYSLKIDTQQYTLFSGLVYSASSSANIVIPIILPISLETTLPNQIISFGRLHGDVREYIPGQDTITVTNTVTGETRTIRVNARGMLF